MKKGDIREGKIIESSYPGKGILYVEDKAVEIKRTIPGQTVRYRVQKVRRAKAEGRLLEVLEKAPDEVEPDCPHFGACGGCAYRNLTEELQRKLKETQMVCLFRDHLISKSAVQEVAGNKEEKETLLEDARRTGIWEGIFASPETDAYRNKMEFSFGDVYKGGPLALGMHKIGGHYDIVTVDQCRIVDEDYRKILTYTLDYFKERNVSFYHTIRHEGYLRHLLIREGRKTGELLIDLITTSQTMWQAEYPAMSQTAGRAESRGLSQATEKTELPEETLRKWAEGLLTISLHNKIVSILHTTNDAFADAVIDQGTEILYGKDDFTEKLFDLAFKITPFSFFQTNTRGAEVLYQAVREYVGDVDGADVYDLYCGTGTITQILAKTAEHVVGVEIVEEAVAAARENAVRNGLHNCGFICGDVLQVLDRLDKNPSAVVLDPPREGVHPKALPKILAFQPERIVYVSCKPTSLQRDLQTITAAGYQLRRACAVDLFPFTNHVECVVLLTRVEAK